LRIAGNDPRWIRQANGHLSKVTFGRIAVSALGSGMSS
jgi:hypothetical protein